jgi:hypothetical protein
LGSATLQAAARDDSLVVSCSDGIRMFFFETGAFAQRPVPIRAGGRRAASLRVRRQAINGVGRRELGDV